METSSSPCLLCFCNGEELSGNDRCLSFRSSLYSLVICSATLLRQKMVVEVGAGRQGSDRRKAGNKRSPLPGQVGPTGPSQQGGWDERYRRTGGWCNVLMFKKIIRNILLTCAIKNVSFVRTLVYENISLSQMTLPALSNKL